jgi:DNA gyrase subunit A
VDVGVVDDADDIVLITASGMIIRTRVAEISMIGRNTQGVKVMNLKPGDRLLAGAVVAGNESEAVVTGDETGAVAPADES